MPLIVHYLIAKSKGLFVHNRRNDICVGRSVTDDYAHILAVADNLGKINGISKRLFRDTANTYLAENFFAATAVRL